MAGLRYTSRRCRLQYAGIGKKKKDRQYEIDKRTAGRTLDLYMEYLRKYCECIVFCCCIDDRDPFLDDREADIFSIAWTISQLMATVGTFQIRVYQATDVQGTFLFGTI